MTQSMQAKPFLPPRWVIRLAWRIHRALYRSSSGRMGLRPPTPDRYGLMQVTTVGRRSGQRRSVMLAYFIDDQNLVTMAMNGWGADEPAWWLNMQASPSVDVELVDGPRRMTGRTAEGQERDRFWAQWQHYDKKLDAYAALRPAETAVVVLEPSEAG